MKVACVFTSTEVHLEILSREMKTLHFYWKIHGLWFKVSDRKNVPSYFQETLMNFTKHCLE